MGKILYKYLGLIFTIIFINAGSVYAGTFEQETNEKSVLKDAQSTGKFHFEIAGSYRLRGEFQDEYDIKTYGTGRLEDFLLSRLRISFDMRFQNFKTFFQLQDAQILSSSFDDSDFKTSNPYHDNMDIRQAYIDYKLPESFKIRLGRQEISFADRRIFGAGNFGNTGRYVWDAARVVFNNNYVESHAFMGRFIIRDPDTWPNKHTPGPTAYTIYTMVKNLPFSLDGFYVLKKDNHGDTIGESGDGNLTSHSIGFRIDGKNGLWDYDLTFVDQFGTWGEDKIRAYGIASRIGYTFDLPLQPHIDVQFINGSGDKNPGDGINGTFDGVFGGADSVLYGWMGLFFWNNIREYRTDFSVSPSDILSFRGEYHYFTLDEKKDAWYYPGKPQRRDINGSSGRELGHELDLTFKYKPVKWLELLGGYCFFVPGEFIEKTGSAPVSQWIFLQTEIFF